MLPIVVLWLAQATGGVQPGGVPTQTPVPHVTPDLASASADPSKEAANVPSPVVTPDPLSASPEVLATVPPDEHGFNGVLVGDNATEGEIEALEGHEGDLAPSIMKNLAVADENPLCTSWAEAGECIKNPQYMFVACAHACGALQYSDIEADCSGWAQDGECEKNPGFMLERCNASCVSLARQGLNRNDHQAHRNPHLASDLLGDEDESASHRAATFIPIFLGVLLLLVGGAIVVQQFSGVIAEKRELWLDASNRMLTRVQRRHPWTAPFLATLTVSKCGTAMICMYYLNETLTVLQTNPVLAAFFPLAHDGVWQQHVAWVDTSNLLGGAAAFCCLLGYRQRMCAFVMLGDTFIDSYLLIQRIFLQYVYGRGLYINELMAKKFSLLGCVALMLTTLHESAQHQTSFSGMLLENVQLSNSSSLALLFGRLLIAVLFLYVGLSELHRLLFQPFTPYLPGDGHDVVWPKAVELLLAVPFIIGVKTSDVARLLAGSLVLEALYAWSWWRIPGDSGSFAHHRRAIHYREHFVTNIATAGGLILLQKLGAGKYTVDELLKKAD